MVYRITLPLLFFAFSFSFSNAQILTKEDYIRAKNFLWPNVNNKTAFNLFVQAHWLPDSSGFWWENQTPEARIYELILFSDLVSRPLFDHQKLADGLKSITEEEVDALQLRLENIEFPAKDQMRFTVKEKTYLLDLKTQIVSADTVKKEEQNPFESTSPDGKWIAYAEHYNLFIKSTSTGTVHQLSWDGEKNFEYGSYYGWFDKMEGENGERPRRFNVNWSPDSRYLQTYICDLRYANKMYMLDYSIDSLYRPRLLSYYRGSPGDTNMVYLTPLIYNVETKTQINTGLPRNTHINSVSFRWSKHPDKVYAHYDERGFQKTHIFQLDLAGNKLTKLVTEKSKTNIDNFDYWLVEEKEKLMFSSEQSGWKQLYSFDLKDFTTRSITNGDYYVNSIAHIDKENGIIYFLASGKEEGRNPYHQHLYKIDLDGENLSLLTPENRHHQIDFSPDGQYFFDNYSTANTPTRSVLREAQTGKIILQVAQARIDALMAQRWEPPQLFTAVARDGKTPIYGALWKPTKFNHARKYPIIDHSYTGPHTQVFPKDFQRVLRVNNQALAELGFIVIVVDGLGTAGRSKAFHDYSYKNMGLNLADHVLAIRQLAQKFPWIDIDRVGIFGHSAGGFDAGHAMLQFPDFYKVAVASSADHDFRMEKAWWPEMYMGWPVDSSYHKVSNITMAKNLKGKLLLVHGSLDDNVNASATFKLAEALVKANKPFDLLILPSQRHGYRGIYMDYFRKKRWNYFVEHLMGEEPIWDIE